MSASVPAALLEGLPGTPGPTLRALCESLDPATRASVREHVLGGTSAEWLALVLTEHGHRIGATTIKRYRRSLREHQGT